LAEGAEQVVKNRVSTTLLAVGFVVWLSAILLLPVGHTAYLMLTAGAVGVFISAVVVGICFKQLFPPSTRV
jgi:hypothetical protein